jgi:hypothetical protein
LEIVLGCSKASKENVPPVCGFSEAESELPMGGLTEQVNGSEACDNQTECKKPFDFQSETSDMRGGLGTLRKQRYLAPMAGRECEDRTNKLSVKPRILRNFRKMRNDVRRATRPVSRKRRRKKWKAKISQWNWQDGN